MTFSLHLIQLSLLTRVLNVRNYTSVCVCLVIPQQMQLVLRESGNDVFLLMP